MTVSQIVTIPVGAQGYDFSFWRPGTEIARESYVVRYGGKPTSASSAGKYTNRPEVDFYHSLGVAVFFVLEHGAADWTKGAQEGTRYGAEMALWCEAIGYPRGLAACFAFDTNVAPGDVRALQFGNAAADEMNDAGYDFSDYADLDVIRMLAVRSSVNWLAGATEWSDPTKPYQPETMPGYELVHVRQIISGSTPNYDNNITLRPWQAWLPHEVPDPTPPVETPPVVVVSPPTVVTVSVPPYDGNLEDDDMAAGDPRIIMDKRYNEAVIVGAGIPRWLSGTEFVELQGEGVKVCDNDAHDSFPVLAARAGIQVLTPRGA